jgi:hypothetical protein
MFPTLTYSKNGIDYFPCTDLFPAEGEDIATNVTASPGGINHTFAWNANLDLGLGWDGMIKLKFGVQNQDTTGGETQRESDWFRLDFAPPTCSVSWPHGETISDTTPLLIRNATDNTGPIQTEWVIDDDPTFNNINGRRQIKAYSVDVNFQVAALAVMGTWYFKIRCKDASPSTNESAWDVSGEFTLLLAIKPHSLTDGVDTIGFIVDEVAVSVLNRLREYASDNDMAVGGANIVEWVARKPLSVVLRLIDGPHPQVPGSPLPSDPFEQYEQAMTWIRGRTLLDIVDVGGSPISIGGTNISYTPSDWIIVSIRIINRPMRENLLYYELTLEEV